MKLQLEARFKCTHRMSVLSNSIIPLMEQALIELQLREAQVKQEAEKLALEKEWIVNQQLKKEKMIKLNVGGTYYCTTVSTLTADPESMLAAMFSGRFHLEKGMDGAYFIDKNGEAFKYVLEFLRTGNVCPTLSHQDLFWLKEEARYFMLNRLVKLLEDQDERLLYLCVDDKFCDEGGRYNAWIQTHLLPKLQEGYHVVPIGMLKLKSAPESSVPKRFVLYK